MPKSTYTDVQFGLCKDSLLAEIRSSGLCFQSIISLTKPLVKGSLSLAVLTKLIAVTCFAEK